LTLSTTLDFIPPPRPDAEALTDALRVKRFGEIDYESVWQSMRAFTEHRGPDTPDEVWLLQHPPVFTLGINGKREHLLTVGDIPVVPVDRGGQVTYHGPGQLIAYVLVNLKRHNLGVRRLVTILERSVIRLLARYGIDAYARPDAPGVYVDERKIASLGLRVRRGCSYHGLSLNVDMDLSPFRRINPCGHPGLEVTQLRDLGIVPDWAQLEAALVRELVSDLGYHHILDDI
jgi:lipoyl(octanoyl) transferase